MATHEAYNTKTAALASGATEAELRYWDRTGVVAPSVAAAAGRGSRRLYAFLDIVQARAAKQLRTWGLSLQKLRRALRVLREHPDQIRHPLAQLRLITDGETLFRLTDDPAVVEDVLRRGQLVSQLAIKPLCEYVRSRLKKNLRPGRMTVEVRGRRYRVTLEPDVVDGGFIAQCAALPGCVTDGETREQAGANIRDAIEDWLASAEDNRLAKAQ
jgi:predicted RNase H-like HicB family nuclease